MRYVALETPELHIERVLQRAARNLPTLWFLPKAVSSRCAFTITPGSGNLRGLFCKRSRVESSGWLPIFRCGFSLPPAGLPPD